MKPGEYQFRSGGTKSKSASALVRQFFAGLQEKRIPIGEAATEAGLTPVALSYWKSGRCAPDIIVIEALCKKYGIRITIP